MAERVRIGEDEILLSDVVVLARSVYPKTVDLVQKLFVVDLSDVVVRFIMGRDVAVGFSLGNEVWVPENEKEFGNFIAHELGHEADRRLWGYYFINPDFSEEIALFSEAMAKLYGAELPPSLYGFGRRVVSLAERNGWRMAKEFVMMVFNSDAEKFFG